MPAAVNRSLITVVAFLSLLSFTPIYAAGENWLVGKWELTQDPDGNEKDWMEFTGDGQAISIAPSGRRVPGEYVVTDNEVRITFTANGRHILLLLSTVPTRINFLHTPGERETPRFIRRSDRKHGIVDNRYVMPPEKHITKRAQSRNHD